LAFVDGWEVNFEQVLVTVDNVTLAENPDKNANDQSQTGVIVAQVSGPWAVNLAAPGPLDSKENNGKSWPLFRLTNQNMKSGSPAFSSSEKYAFSFDFAKAVFGATNVNLDAASMEAYKKMAATGQTLWLKGTAAFKGVNCRSSVASYDFTRVPKSVQFAFGLTIPTSYKNCVNPELQPMQSKGIQIQSAAETVTQITAHLDHVFWEALEEDAALRFDSIAAKGSVASGVAASGNVNETVFRGVDFQNMKDAQNTALPWRTCGPILPNERTTGTVSYRPVNTPVNAAGGKLGLKDWYDYVQYNTSTFGHLNNDGLCFPARKFDSPN
jgi:hypothetical protein